MDASRQRHNMLWRSRSETNLTGSPLLSTAGNGCISLVNQDEQDSTFANEVIVDSPIDLVTPGRDGRPNSWSPADDHITNLLIDAATTGPTASTVQGK